MEGRVGEFIIEKKYKFLLIQVLAILVLQDDGIDREQVHIFLAKGHYREG